MDVKDINKGLVVYHDRIGLLVVDKVLDSGMVSCNNGCVKVYPPSLDSVDDHMLRDRGITRADLDRYHAHI